MSIGNLTQRLSAVCCALALGASGASAATVVVNNDEWTLANGGFANAPDTGQFVENLVSELGTRIHAYSTNFGFTGSSLASAMSSAGATYSTGLGISFDLPTLQTYDALLLGGNALSAAQFDVLDDYVASGGNLYIAGGTAGIPGGALGEANHWNPFLATFGVQMATSYNGVSGNISASGDPLMTGVSALYYNNGNDLSGPSVFCCGDDGLLAVARVEMAAVPLPAGAVLMVSALGLCAGFGWRQRRAA